jgi:serine/threonine protein kinase
MIAEQHVLALPAGYQLGKYIFKSLLGSGGFGITYLAEDTSLDRKVAINEMLPNEFATRLGGTTVVAKTRSDKTDLEWARARFVDEGRALAACDHPNVIDVYEMIEANGTAYMVSFRTDQ